MAVWLARLLFGLPWLGALAVWVAGRNRHGLQYLIAIVTGAVAGVAGLAMLLVRANDAAFALIPHPVGRRPGFFPILSVTTVALGGLLLALVLGRDLARSREHGLSWEGTSFALWPLATGGVAGLSVSGESGLVLLFSYGLLVYTFYRLITYGGIVEDIRSDMDERRDRDRYDIL